MVNPRLENPLDFLFLDIASNTFRFTEWPDAGTDDFQKAHFTIKLLKLNQRSYLVNARRNAFGNYKARLKEYVSAKNEGAALEHLAALAFGIETEHHSTVWAEMKRQQSNLPEIASLFQQAPELLDEAPFAFPDFYITRHDFEKCILWRLNPVTAAYVLEKEERFTTLFQKRLEHKPL